MSAAGPRPLVGQLAVMRQGFRRYAYYVHVPISPETYNDMLTRQEKRPVRLAVKLPKMKRT